VMMVKCGDWKERETPAAAASQPSGNCRVIISKSRGRIENTTEEKSATPSPVDRNFSSQFIPSWKWGGGESFFRFSRFPFLIALIVIWEELSKRKMFLVY
jgi:hypothetical protein